MSFQLTYQKNRQYTTINLPDGRIPTADVLAMYNIMQASQSLLKKYKLRTGLPFTAYHKLLLSLQSPLPNEQDLALSVFNTLSNVKKYVLDLTKSPRLLDHLLAHAGVFSHCGLRELTEEVYTNGRGYSLSSFWSENLRSNDGLDLLCEEFVTKFKNNLGINLYENDLPKLQDEESEPTNSDPVVEDQAKELDQQRSIISPEVEEPEEDFPDGEENATPSTPSLCCASCVCHKDETVFCLKSSDDGDDPSVVSFRRSKNTEQAGLRITQICHIIRNLSFEHGNAEVMGRNQTVQRFLLLCMKCQWSNLSQLCWDSFRNIAKHMELKEPMLDPLSSMFISMTIESLLSPDRFHIMRSLEILNGWFAGDLNDKVLLPYVETKIFERICECLRMNDIVILIYTLECMMSMTARGEEVCDKFARVAGSVNTLVSLLTAKVIAVAPGSSKGSVDRTILEQNDLPMNVSVRIETAIYKSPRLGATLFASPGPRISGVGIKRARSLFADKSSGHEGGSDHPEIKKPSLSTNGCGSTPPPLKNTYASTVDANANSYRTQNFKNISTLENENSKTTSAIKSEIINENHVLNNNSESLTLHKPTATNPKTTANSTTSSLNNSIGQTSTANTQPAVGSNSLELFPITIAIELPLPRQLVLPSGQTIRLKETSNQTYLQRRQIFMSPISFTYITNGEFPKIIIPRVRLPQKIGHPQPSSALGNTKMVTAGEHKLKQIVESPKTQEHLDLEAPYLCEWAGCGLRFKNHQRVMLHAVAAHCSQAVTEARCEWGQNGCDPLLRKRYSLMTHLQDRHCSKKALNLALYRRKNKIDPPQPLIKDHVITDGFKSIRRYAGQLKDSKELMDEKEGPVTRSIRVIAALILRNMCMHSSIGREKLNAHESHLAAVGMSKMESSSVIAYILFELHKTFYSY